MEKNFKQLKQAIIHSSISKYSVYIVQLGSLMLYSRWFTPEEFGVIAILQVFSIFFLMLGEVGLGPALINIKKISSSDRDGLFSLTWVIGLCIALTFFLITFILNGIYGRDDYQILGLFACLSIVFSCANTLPNSFLLREKKFTKLAVNEVYAEVFSCIIMYLLFKQGLNLQAIASRPLSVSIIRVLLNYKALSLTEFGRASWNWKPCSIKPFLKFTGYQFAFNFLNYFSRNLDNILIGKYVGMVALGVYDKSYMLMKYPLQLLTFAISPAIQPVLSKLSERPEEIELIYRKLVYYLAFISGLLSLIVYYNSEHIVLIMLGDQWGAVTPVLEVFALSIPVQVILSTSGGIFQSAERTDLMFKSGVFSSITNVSAIIIGVYFQELTVIAIALLISFSINFIQCYYLMYKYLFKVKLLRFFYSISFGFGTTVFVFLVTELFSMYLFNINNGLILSLLQSGVICLLFSLFFYFHKKIEQKMSDI